MKTKLLTVILIISGFFFNISEVNACPPPPPPAAPTNLSAEAVSSNQIDLNWQDNSNNESGFQIERSLDGNNYSLINVTYVNYYCDTNQPLYYPYQIGSGLSPGTKYWYRIRAYNSGGNSAYSDPAYATTYPGKATSPSPAHEAIDVVHSPTLKWTSGVGATSHKVYYGINPVPNEYDYKDTIADTNLYVSYVIPDTLAPDTYYYWRIDELNAAGTTTGDIWSFQTTCVGPPGKATTLIVPSNGAINVSVMSAYLSWTAGPNTTSHNVYFGTSNPLTNYGNQTGTTFNLGRLNTNTTYYWRIDEENACDTNEGTVWSFTTQSVSPTKAIFESPTDNATGVSVMTDLSWSPGAYATSHIIYFGTTSPGTLQGEQAEAETTFDPGILDQGETYYWRIDEKNATGTTTGTVWQFETQVTDPNNYVSTLGSDETGNGSPDKPYHTIQMGINTTPAGCKVIVMEGRYEEDIDFNGRDITVTSLDPNDPDVVAATIIDGTTNVVTFDSGEDPNSVLAGFTITDANRGIYCTASSPTITNCVIMNNLITSSSGAGMYNNNASPIVTNCTFKNNRAKAGGGVFNNSGPSPQFTNCIFSENISVNPTFGGGGMYNYSSSPIIKSCVFYGNTGSIASGIRNVNSSPEIINCSFSNNLVNYDSHGVIHNTNSYPVITNCILWDTPSTPTREIRNVSGSLPIVTYCDIPDEAYSGEGNIHSDPCFVNADNPDGADNIFGTLDDGLRLESNSPCIDAANGDEAPGTDVRGIERLDIIDLVPNTGSGNPDYADIGAYEYDEAPGYTTSFEEYQGFDYDFSIDGNDGWEVEGVNGKTVYEYYYEDNGNGSYTRYPYQYVGVRDSDIIYNTSGSCRQSYIRINCVPSDGSSINIMNGSSRIASIKFGEYGDPNIYVLNNGIYRRVALTGLNYTDIATQCFNFVVSPEDYYWWKLQYPDFSYENSWMDFTIHLDWTNHTYDVKWTHYAAPEGETIYTGAGFNPDCQYYTKVKFENHNSWRDFMLNRMSIIDTPLEGGDVGTGEDMWITIPDVPADANILNPLQGHCIIGGKAWYDKLGEYVVKCCPVDLNPDDVNSWMQVCSGKSVGGNLLRLGYWNTEAYYNGDYFLKIEVYDDLGRLHKSGIITAHRAYNGGDSNTVCVKYPIVGRLKPQTFNYQERPDLTINWPGTFPFEFKRTYSNSLRSRIFPLFFGWTHNHNIRLIEDSSDDWIRDGEIPVRDEEGLGVGRLWLCLPSGGGLFIGRIDAVNPQRVIYEPLDDNENRYIIRRSSVASTDTNSVIDVNYVYYDMSNGMKMTFDRNGVKCDHVAPQNEGLVGWMVTTVIRTQEDRFGNALLYTWDDDDICLNEISNNRTPAKLVFTNDLLGLPLIREIQIYNGYDLTDAYVRFDPSFDLGGGATYTLYKGSSDDYTMDQIEYSGGNGKQYTLENIRTNARGGDISDEFTGIITWVENDDDGTLIKREEAELSSYYSTIKEYDYEYDNEGNLITTVDVSGETWHSGKHLLRKEVVTTSPDGALLRVNISAFDVNLADGNKFDPCDYHSRYNWHIDQGGPYGKIRQIMFHPGGGGAVDTEYDYADSNFPVKPTTIIEYFDDDGDGDYDRRSRRSTNKYDSRGNVIENKVYVDDVNYVYTTLAYHHDYDFPIRQTTWQEYCGNGARVEKQWRYGNYDGTQIATDGNSGDYLVQEKTLLSDIGAEEWAETYYKYYYYPDINGLLKQMTDPNNNITYYQYDSYGFVSKEWQGATLNINGDPTGNPQKRYCYNGLGHKLLEADYLGKVEVNIYNGLGQLSEAMIHIDNTAMSRPSFAPSDYDYYERLNRTFYRWYYGGDKPFNVVLPTGGSIYNSYVPGVNGLYSGYYSLCDTGHTQAAVCQDGGSISYKSTPEGRTLYERRRYATGLDWKVDIDYLYDSMFRVIHKYSHFYNDTDYCTQNCDCEEDDCDYSWHRGEYIKHEEFEYDASGNKIGEVVYKVAMEEESGVESFTQVLEKSNRYEYDILGRLTKQVIDANDEGGLNQTTQFGYDAVGNRIYIVDPNGNIIFTDYDNANRKVREYFAARPSEAPVLRKEFHYYKNGSIKDVNSYDYNGSLHIAGSAYTYDSRGRIKTVIEDVNISTSQIATTRYDYNDTGYSRDGDSYKYHIKITDAASKVTWISMHPLGKPAKILYPSGDYEEYIYYNRPLNDPDNKYNGLLEQKAVWDASGNKQHITYEYDAFGKVEKIIYPDGYLQYEYLDTYGLPVENKIRLLGQFGLPTRITDHRITSDRPGVEDSNFMFTYWYESGKIKSYTDYDGYTVNYDYSCAYGQPTDINVTNPDGVLIYDVNYVYDLAGRLTDVCEPMLGSNSVIADFGYDKNGNRSQLNYYLEGSKIGDTVSVDYTYNRDNMLTKFATTGGPVFNFGGTYGPLGNWANVDGLGRLKNASETIAYPGQNKTHNLGYTYDMRSQLTTASISNIGIGGSTWTYNYNYRLDGNIETKTVNSADTDYAYDGDTMTGAGSATLTWNDNGQLTATPAISFGYNWDGKLCSATAGPSSISLKYDPMGNRVWKQSAVSGQTTTRKYIIDISGNLPTILLEIDPGDSSLKKSYVYANSQILAQHDVPDNNKRYFYLHDRLGSVREMIDSDGDVVSSYTYNPFGEVLESGHESQAPSNSLLFTGQYYDSEIGQYYLRARMYDPQLMRFTSRDPVGGRFEEPLTFHRYLYCGNESINRIDLDGRFALTLSGSLSGSMNVSMFSGVFGSIPYGKALQKAVGGLMSYNYLLLPLQVVNSYLMVGGTLGAGIVAAKDESQKGWNQGWSLGAMYFAAGGGGLASSTGGSATLNIGYSPNAQHVKDLAGNYTEVGGSVSFGVPPWFGGVFYNFTFGASYAKGDNGINLYTISPGTGFRGWEGHVYRGYTSVVEWQ